jgi:DNA-binding CsgD family transcriptional regulator
MDRRAVLRDLAASAIEQCHAGHDLEGLRREVLPRLRRAVTADAVFFAVADPATLMHTWAYLDEFPERLGPHFLDNEFHADDVNKWIDLARGRESVSTLLRATDGRLEDSARYRDILAPLGMGDELRAAMRIRGVCWGYMCLHRERGAVFTSEETAFVRRLAPHLAEGIRTALLLGSVDMTDLEDAPGLVVLAADGSTLSTSPSGARWLDELQAPAHGLPHALEMLAASARRTGPSQQATPRVHIRTRAGRWAVLHACPMPPAGDGAIAVVIEQAAAPQIAPIVMLAYGLTQKEQTVTSLSCRGHTTQEIAGRLHLSPHTVRDHLKSVFTKVGVGSSRELAATIMQQQYVPRANAGLRLGPSGFYLERDS